MDSQATNSSSEDKKPIEAIGYIEEMNNGRYYVSCGNEKSVDAYWYITEDTEEDAIKCILNQNEDPDVQETFGTINVSEIYILKNFMFHDRNLKFQDAIVRVIDVENGERS